MNFELATYIPACAIITFIPSDFIKLLFPTAFTPNNNTPSTVAVAPIAPIAPIVISFGTYFVVLLICSIIGWRILSAFIKLRVAVESISGLV